MRELIVSYYEDRLPKLSAFFGSSGYYNFGYWRADTKSAAVACGNLMGELLGLVPRLRGRALDVACGLGATTGYLAQHFKHEDIVAINISEPQLQKARTRVPECLFLCMDAVELEFPNESFDLVLCVEAAFHFNTRERFLREALRIITPGGYLAVADLLVRKAEQLIPADNILSSPEQYDRLLRGIGFDHVTVRDVTAQVLGGFVANFASWMEAKNVSGELSDADYDELARNLEGIRSGASHYVLCAARKPELLAPQTTAGVAKTREQAASQEETRLNPNRKSPSRITPEPGPNSDRGCPVELPAFDPGFKSSPFPLYQKLMESGTPISFVHVSTGIEAWLVTGYEEARRLLNDPRLSKDSRYAGPNWHAAHPTSKNGTSNPVFRHLLTMDPPEHTRLRAMVAKVFLPKQIEMLRPRIEAVATELLDAISPRGHADLIEEFARPLPLRVICELLGIPAMDQPLFRRWSELLVTAELEEQHLIPIAAAELQEYLLRLAVTKREQPDESPYCDLVVACDRGELTDSELAAMGFLLLVAGHETTVNLIGNGMLALLSERSEWARICADKSCIPAAVEELLRFGSPVEIATPRFAKCKIVVGDVQIRRGDAVFIGLAASNRDPARFEHPMCLDIERETAIHHLAFGYGIHYCVGAPLARVEGVIAFDALASRFPDMSLAREPHDLSWRLGLLIRGVRELPVTFKPRSLRHG